MLLSSVSRCYTNDRMDWINIFKITKQNTMVRIVHRESILATLFIKDEAKRNLLASTTAKHDGHGSECLKWEGRKAYLREVSSAAHDTRGVESASLGGAGAERTHTARQHGGIGRTEGSFCCCVDRPRSKLLPRPQSEREVRQKPPPKMSESMRNYGIFTRAFGWSCYFSRESLRRL